MITYDMVKSGYETGLVTLILDPHNGRIACSIGDYWFYFGGHTAEEYTSVDAYKRDIPADDIVKEIYDVLDAFQKEDAFQDEYLYYEAFLRERMHDDVEKQMHEIIAEVGDWFGTFSEVGSQIQIDNGWEVFAYNSPREALQDWIYDMISGDARDWNPEIQFLMANGIKVEGVRVVEGKDDKVRYMAVIDYPLSNGKTRHLSAGTFATPQAAYSALLAAQILRKECLAANMSLVDFTAKLKDLRAEGKTPVEHSVSSIYLKKHMDVDVIAFLQNQMENNTMHYQSDFNIDKEHIEKAAASDRKEDKTLLWLSRPMGTQCVSEHDAFVRGSSAYTTWLHYAGEADNDYIAYAVELTNTDNGVIRGNVCKLDFKSHAAEVAEKAVTPDYHIWTFEDGEAVHVPFGDASYGLCSRLVSQHGNMIDSVLVPQDKEQLANVLREQAASRALARIAIMEQTLSPETKQPLNEQIQSASTRAATSQAGSPAKEPSIENKL